MSVIEKIAATVLSFLISLFCFMAVICLIFSQTFSNPSFMTDTLEKRNYYDTIYSEYCESVESLAIPAGIDEGVFSSVVQKEEFVENINHIVYAAYNDSDAYAGSAFDYEYVYGRFYDCMVEMAKDKEFEITDEITEGIDNVAGLCASTCRSHVTLPFIDTLGSYATEFGKYLQIGGIVCGVVSAFLIAFVFLLRSWRKAAIFILSSAFIADGIMLITAPVAVLASGKIRYLQIEIKSLYLFAVGYVERMLNVALAVGITVLVIGIILAVVSVILKLKRKEDLSENLKQ